MPRICRTSSWASLTASLPTVSLRRPRLGTSIWAHGSRSMGCASPPIFTYAQPRNPDTADAGASRRSHRKLQRSGEFRRIAAFYALPVLINQTLDSEWFRVLTFIGTIAFALSGVVLAYAGQYSLFGALILASLPALGGGVVRDLLLQRDPLGIVRNPEALLIVFATVLAGMVVIKTVSHIRAPPLARYLQSHARLGSRLIEAFDAVALAAFTVVGVVVVLDTSARPLWLWGPIAAVLTASFGGLMRDMLRHDRVVANLRGELYPEIAAVWGLAFAIFLEWEGERLQPEEIRLGVIVTILGVFLTRIVAIVSGAKGWSYV